MPPPSTLPTTNPAPPPINAPTPRFKHPKIIKVVALVGLVVLCLASIAGAYVIGKHGQRVIVRRPAPPPITLPPQAIVFTECVPGLGKQYGLPKDIPNGPIYNVKNSKVIAVEYNYKAVDLFLNPNRLSDTIIPLTKNYQVDHFTSSIGELKGGSAAEAQQVPVRLIMYMVPQSEADTISCAK